MKWILFLITINSNGDNLERIGDYDDMTSCFQAWEVTNDKMTDYGNKEKVNFSLICTIQDLTKQ